MARDINDTSERMAHVQKDVFALGLCIYPAGHLKDTMRVALTEMQGMDYAEVPYNLAHSMFQTLEVYIRKNLSYLKGVKMIDFDRDKAVLKLTPFGDTTMKKLTDRIRKLI